MTRMRRHLSYANVASTLALVMALGGTAYAGATLARNSVGSGQLKRGAVANSDLRNNSVTSGKIRNGAIRAADLAPGVIRAGAAGATGPRGLTGAQGPQGPQGTAGANGTARAFARVDAAGTLIGGTDQNKGIVQANIQHDAVAGAETTGAGVYCIGGLGFTPTSVSVTTDNTDALPAAPASQGGSLNFISTGAIFKGEDLGRCNNDHGQVRIAMERVDQTNPPELVNHGFFVWLEG